MLTIEPKLNTSVFLCLFQTPSSVIVLLIRIDFTTWILQQQKKLQRRIFEN